MHHGSVCPEGAQTRVLNGITYIGFAIRAPALICNDNGHHWKFENQWKSPRDSLVACHMTPLQNPQSCHCTAGSRGIVSDLAMSSGCNGHGGSYGVLVHGRADQAGRQARGHAFVAVLQTGM